MFKTRRGGPTDFIKDEEVKKFFFFIREIYLDLFWKPSKELKEGSVKCPDSRIHLCHFR